MSEVVRKVAQEMVDRTISIPRITVVPAGELSSGFDPFNLDVSRFSYPPVDDDLISQTLREGTWSMIGVSRSGVREARPEDYVISGLIDFDEISYDDHADSCRTSPRRSWRTSGAISRR